MRVIADTCVWSQFFRRNRSKSDPVALELERLVRLDAVFMLGVIRLELLAGAQPQDRFVQLKEQLRYFPNVPLDEEDDENAAAYYNVCRANGVQGTAIDLLICAVAVRHEFRIFTVDADFAAYARHLPIKLHVARGVAGKPRSH